MSRTTDEEVIVIPMPIAERIAQEAEHAGVSYSEALRGFLVLGLAQTPDGAPRHTHNVIADGIAR